MRLVALTMSPPAASEYLLELMNDKNKAISTLCSATLDLLAVSAVGHVVIFPVNTFSLLPYLELPSPLPKTINLISLSLSLPLSLNRTQIRN